MISNEVLALGGGGVVREGLGGGLAVGGLGRSRVARSVLPTSDSGEGAELRVRGMIVSEDEDRFCGGVSVL